MENYSSFGETLRTTPMTDLTVATQLPGLDPKKARRSLARFAMDVLPAFK